MMLHNLNCVMRPMINILSSYGRVSMIQVKHKKMMGTEGLSFHYPNLLCCLNQMHRGQQMNDGKRTKRGQRIEL